MILNRLGYQIFLFFVTICTLASGELDPVKLEQVDQLISELMTNSKVPGLGLAIVENGEIVLTKGYGLKDITLNIPTSENTLFSIGSITKSLVATLTVKTLHEKFPELGEKVLDTPINKLLEQLNLRNASLVFSDRYRTNYMTFRDMLSHRNCLMSTGVDFIFDAIHNVQEVFYRYRYMTETCNFRAGWNYNNAMYAIAAELIAGIKGKALGDVLVDFMREIGMDSGTFMDVDGNYESIPDLSSPYTLKDDQIIDFNPLLLRRVYKVVGAGGILASAKDMANYMNFHLNRGKVGNKQIIPEEVMGWIYTVSFPLNSVQGKMNSETDRVTGNMGYALGLEISLYDGWNMVSHGGYWPPYASQMNLFPGKGIGIFMSSNGPGAIGSDAAGQAQVVARIFDVLRETSKAWIPIPKPMVLDFEINQGFGKTSTDISERLSLLPKRKGSIQPEDLVGIYGDAVNGDAIITMDPVEQTLVLNYGTWGIANLLPTQDSETRFLIELTTDLTHHFYTYSAMYPYPLLEADFSLEYTFFILTDSVPMIAFHKNATLETFPEIPWTPDSCGPSRSSN